MVSRWLQVAVARFDPRLGAVTVVVGGYATSSSSNPPTYLQHGNMPQPPPYYNGYQQPAYGMFQTGGYGMQQDPYGMPPQQQQQQQQQLPVWQTRTSHGAASGHDVESGVDPNFGKIRRWMQTTVYIYVVDGYAMCRHMSSIFVIFTDTTTTTTTTMLVTQCHRVVIIDTNDKCQPEISRLFLNYTLAFWRSFSYPGLDGTTLNVSFKPHLQFPFGLPDTRTHTCTQRLAWVQPCVAVFVETLMIYVYIDDVS